MAGRVEIMKILRFARLQSSELKLKPYNARSLKGEGDSEVRLESQSKKVASTRAKFHTFILIPVGVKIFKRH